MNPDMKRATTVGYAILVTILSVALGIIYYVGTKIIG
jgi:Flp pilus assembly pilin Flp